MIRTLLTFSSPRMERVPTQWSSNIPSLTDEPWSEVTESMLPSVISTREKLIKFNYLYRIYYALAYLDKMGRADSLDCPRCNAAVRNYFQMIWLCPLVGRFWAAILKFLEEKLALPNIYSPARCLLGDFGGGYNQFPENPKDSLFMPKKVLALRWKGPVPPSLQF